MALSQPRQIFGIHDAVPYNRTTGKPYGNLRVLQSSSLSLEGELIDSMGGSQKYAWASEDGAITAEMSLAFDEFPDFVSELFLGAAPTASTAETSGNVGTAANKYGSTIIDASNGISSVSLLSGSAANLKFGKYLIEAATASTFDVYYKTSVDVGRGTDGTHQSDLMKITASPLGFTASVASIPSFGLQFNQVGTPAFTFSGTPNTAEFEVRPVNSASSYVVVGALANQSFPEFGCLLYAQKRGNQQMFEVDAYRCKGVGMPLPFARAEFAAFEVTAKLLYDAALDGILKWRHVSP